MPKRQNIVRLDSSEVQGEGSFVVVRAQSVREMRDLTKSDAYRKLVTATDAVDSQIAMFDLAPDTLKRILEWNWVDDDDEPLPLPKDDPEIFDKLTQQEFEFLVDAVGRRREAEELKNSVSGAGTGSNSR